MQDVVNTNITRKRRFVPVAFVKAFLDVAFECGCIKDELLVAANLTPQVVANTAFIDLPEYEQLILAILKQAGDRPLGRMLGSSLSPLLFGPYGVGLLTAPTLRDAITVFQRFWHFYVIGVSVDVIEEECLCVMDFRVHSGVPETLHVTLLELSIFGTVNSLLNALPNINSQLLIEFDARVPKREASSSTSIKNIAYNTRSNRITFNSQWLSESLPLQNDLAHSEALAHCEQEESITPSADVNFIADVERELCRNDGGYLTLDQVAQNLNLSPRTLRRRLADEGETFSNVLANKRLQDSLRLLNQKHFTIQEIAEKLGYRDVANFSRVFKKWTGKTPAQFKNEQS